MKILIDINHPADVHQFKNLISQMSSEGHEFKIIARDKDCTLDLLKSENINYTLRKGYNGIKKLIGLVTLNWTILKEVVKFKPDLLIGGPGDCYIAQVGFLTRIPSIIFDDTEFSKTQNMLTFPFAKKIATPTCYWLDLGKKQIRYEGYHELAYLAPKYFKPSKKVVKEAGINPEEKYVILRLVEWQASHDMNSNEMKGIQDLIKEIEKFAKVYISSERKLDFKANLINISPEKIHHVLYYATMLFGESSTMASEAAVLGTPAIYVSNAERGYTKELEEKYDMVYYFDDQKKALKKAKELISRKNLKREWAKKRERMLKDKVDVTAWMIKLLKKFEK